MRVRMMSEMLCSHRAVTVCSLILASILVIIRYASAAERCELSYEYDPVSKRATPICTLKGKECRKVDYDMGAKPRWVRAKTACKMLARAKFTGTPPHFEISNTFCYCALEPPAAETGVKTACEYKPKVDPLDATKLTEVSCGEKSCPPIVDADDHDTKLKSECLLMFDPAEKIMKCVCTVSE